MRFTKKILLFNLLFFCSHFLFSQTDSAYYEFLIHNEKEYKNFTDIKLREYEQFKFEYNQALDFYKEKVYKIWEGNKKIENEKEIYTEYSDDFKSRMIIDFKNGNVTIETILEKGDNKDEITKLSLDKHINTKGKYVSTNSKINNISNQKLLKNQTNKTEINNLKYKTENIVGNDGKKRETTKLELKLAPNHIKKRAKLYLPIIQKYSKKYDIKPELVLAMIQTESYFNPKAKSSAPAYGLMQLVPKYGGRVAYKYVKGEDKIPIPSYLYKPVNNIELGCAYIKILKTKVFGNIKDEKSRLYCVIASYNCGAGKLAQAFVNSKNLYKASKIINQKTSDEVFEILKNKLPYETQKYLPLVLSRTRNFKQWLN